MNELYVRLMLGVGLIRQGLEISRTVILLNVLAIIRIGGQLKG